MLTVALAGGLGNQLFQIAAGDTLAKRTGRTFQFVLGDPTVHSDQAYCTTILRQWASRICPSPPADAETLYEESYDYREPQSSSPNVTLHGYFQTYRYVSSDFGTSLELPSVEPLPGAFLHIRGGDYVNHPLHDVGLEAYYARAVAMFPPGTHFYVFTNDVAYAKTRPILQTISHSFITESDEVVCLAKMKSCLVGGICANSTFSWWGAYLNRYARTLVLPSKWFNDDQVWIDGYFFPGSLKCQV